MSALYNFSPTVILRNKGFPELESWKLMYKFISYGVGLNDRTNTLKQPIRTAVYPKCKLPELQIQSLNYNDCCNYRANELLEKSRAMQIPLGIMWSGGIDSTRLLISFLQNFPLSDLKDSVKIITSQDAVHENPKFFKNYILPNFDLINSEAIPWLFNKQYILVTGELNDQLFGSDLLRNYLIYSNTEYLEPLNKSKIFNYVNCKIEDTFISTIVVDTIFKSADRYGIVLEKNSDWFWWYNFCFKWQKVYMRTLALPVNSQWGNINESFVNNFLHHFYNTEYFQLWSINNPQIRNFSKWSDYKFQAKKEIYDFNKDNDYFENKIKRGSLQTLYHQRIHAAGLDENFNLLSDINLADWYLPDNDFIK
jgi:hypothetical protein